MSGGQLLLGQRPGLRLRQHPGTVQQLLVHTQLCLVEDSWLDDCLLEPGEELPVLLDLGSGRHQVGGADGVDRLVQGISEQARQELGLELCVVCPELVELPLVLEMYVSVEVRPCRERRPAW